MTNDFTEAPASVNLKFNYKGFSGVMLTLRASTGTEVLTKLDGALIALEKMGAIPNGKPVSSQNGDTPSCQHHGSMKRSQHFAGWYCPKKLDNGKYCSQKVKD